MTVSKRMMIFGLLCLVPLCGCASMKKPKTVIEKKYVVVSKPATVPEGAARYCWEEPIVKHEGQRAGLDVQGHWYHPSYTAVREVRMGKWRPCRAN